jgi:hypothetical protein
VGGVSVAAGGTPVSLSTGEAVFLANLLDAVGDPLADRLARVLRATALDSGRVTIGAREAGVLAEALAADESAQWMPGGLLALTLQLRAVGAARR